MPIKAIEPPESAKLQVVEDMATSMKEAWVAEVGHLKTREVLVANKVGEAGVVRTTADSAAKATSAAHRMEVVEGMPQEEELVVGMDSSLEPTEVDTTHKVRAAGTTSKAKVVDTINKPRMLHMVSHRRATIPTDSKVVMILSLVLEDRTARGRHPFLLKIPQLLRCHCNSSRKELIRSARKVSKTDTDGVHDVDFSRRLCFKSVVLHEAAQPGRDGSEQKNVQSHIA